MQTVANALIVKGRMVHRCDLLIFDHSLDCKPWVLKQKMLVLNVITMIENVQTEM